MRTGGVGPIRLLVLQPTPFCSLDCHYCYLPSRTDRRRMRMDTVAAIGRNVLASPLAGDPLSVVWHGGEPLTVPVEWYEEAFAVLASAAPGRSFVHGFQTNGIHIDDRWIDLFQRWNVRVGVSLDGPPELHDRYRRTRNGGGSFARVMRGVERLQARRYPFHIIAVLTAESMVEPDRLIDFFVTHGLRDVAFNIEEEEGAHGRTSLSDRDGVASYRRFMECAARRATREPDRFRCREVEAVRGLIAAPAWRRRDNPLVRPLSTVSISVDGGMSTYCPELLGVRSASYSDFIFADVHVDGPEAVLLHPAFRHMRADVDDGVGLCRKTCAYFDVCGGGAPANKFFENGGLASGETLFCRLTRQVALDAVMEVFESHDATAS